MTQNETKTHFLVVLDDGETYTDLDSARIVEVTEEAYEQIQNDARIKNLSKEDGIVGVFPIQDPIENGERWDTWWDSIL